MKEADETLVQTLALQTGLPLSIARVLYHRGITSQELATRFLGKSLNDLSNPFELTGLRHAAERVVAALTSDEGILVHGDFDADGISSTALLVLFLRRIGARVEAYIPNRLFEGHGISMKALELAKNKNCRLMITCDCGSSNAEEIRQFLKEGVETIVTDHHHVGDSESTPAILVNPKHDDDSGQEGLAGVGVAFMLTVAVRAVMREKGLFTGQPEPNLKEYLDIVALGTVADMAPLLGQNRILVSEGLAQIAISKRPIFAAMKNRLKTQSSPIGTDDIGFKFAPRFNAAARLGHADEAFKALVTEDLGEAYRLLDALEAWNQERKLIQEKMYQVSYGQAKEQADQGRASIVVSSAEFHPGVSGLVAQKIAENFSRPTFIFAVERDLAKASARSRNGMSIHDILLGCRDLLLQFGGHDEAGGCTMKTSLLPEFRERVEALALGMGGKSPTLHIDAALDLAELNDAYFETIKRLKPFGMGNPEPLFMAEARLAASPKQVGQGHFKATVLARDGRPFDAIGFGLWREEAFMDRIEMVFTIEENFWQGRKNLQLVLKSIR